MADITVKAWINEIKKSQYGEIWKVAESHSKKNAQGEYENDGRSYYDVYVDSKDSGKFEEKQRVEIVGRFRSKENEAKDGTKYRNLLIYANEIRIATTANAGATTGGVPAGWEEIPVTPEDAPF